MRLWRGSLLPLDCAAGPASESKALAKVFTEITGIKLSDIG